VDDSFFNTLHIFNIILYLDLFKILVLEIGNGGVYIDTKWYMSLFNNEKKINNIIRLEDIWCLL